MYQLLSRKLLLFIVFHFVRKIFAVNNYMFPIPINNGRLEFDLSFCPFLPTIIPVKEMEDISPQCGETSFGSNFNTTVYSKSLRERGWVCLSQHPIDLIFEGGSVLQFQSFETGRFFLNTTNENPADVEKTPACFYIRFSVYDIPKPGSFFSCSTFDQKYKFKQHVGYRVSKDPEMKYTAQEIEYGLTDLVHSVSLPCPCSNETNANFVKDGVIVPVADGGAITYDSGVGFIINLSRMENPYGEYECTSYELDYFGDYMYVTGVSFNHVNVLQREFQVFPPGDKIHINETRNVTVSCESTQLIQLNLGGLTFPAKLSDSNQTMFKYKVSKVMEKEDVNYGRQGKHRVPYLECSNTRTKQIYHQWALIGSEIDKSGIYLDKSQRLFFCGTEQYCKKDSDIYFCPRITIMNCTNQISCNILKNCFFQPQGGIFGLSVPAKGEVIRSDGDVCDLSRIPNDRDYGSMRRDCNVTVHSSIYRPSVRCARVDTELEYAAGLIRCSSNTIHKWVHFFKGLSLNGSVPEIILNWRDVDKEHYLQIISVEDPNRIYFISETIELSCLYSTYLFGRGIQWRYQMKNGSIAFINDLVFINQDRSETAGGGANVGYVTSSIKMHVWDTQMKSVLCFLPMRNSTEWVNDTFNVEVSAKVPVKILEPANAKVYESFPVGTQQSIKCVAMGGPIPSIQWSNGKGSIQAHENLKLKDKIDWKNYTRASELIFLTLSEDQADTYVCNISHDGGIYQMSFVVSTYYPLVLWQKLLAAGSMVVLTIFLGMVTYLLKKLYRKNKAIKLFREGKEGVSVPENLDGIDQAKLLRFDPDDEIKTAELTIGKAIGGGNFGIVNEAILRRNELTKTVAVKSIKNKCLHELNSMILEYQVMKYIGKHDNVVQLIGIVQENIYNYYQNTSDLLKWSLQISSGLKYLEQLKIVHCDISTRNILLNEMRLAKICDFGLSEKLPKGRSYVVQVKTFAWQWASPETQHYFKFSCKADIWSFGVTLWEIFSLGQTPYEDYTSQPDNFDNRSIELHPMTVMPKPTYATQSIYDVIKQCWKVDPAERISLQDVGNFFESTLIHVIQG